MADRFYSAESPRDNVLRLDGDEAKHLARVARRQVGDVVEIFNGLGAGFLCEVVTIQRDAVTLSILESVADRVAPVDLTLFVSPPKGDRFDWIVEKATELGVSRLVPILCDRSVVDPRSAKMERLRRVVVEASKQCGRNRFMILDEPAAFSRIVGGKSEETHLIADMGGLSARDWPIVSNRGRISLAVGPEGGWTEAERQHAAESGWVTVGLGSTRLRVETAAVIGPAIVFARTLLEDGS